MKFWKRVERRARQERHYRPDHNRVQLGYFLLDTCAVLFEVIREMITANRWRLSSKQRRGRKGQ